MHVSPRRAAPRALALAVACLVAGAAHAGTFRFGGKVFADLSRIDVHSAGGAHSSDTDGDLKRLYLSAGYDFDSRWSADVTVDVQWLRGHRDPDLWFKHAYLQRRLGAATTLRLGASDMPMTALVSKWYGFRYIDSSGTGLQKLDSASDWGVHLAGPLASKLDYAVAVVTGAGYKRPSHGARADVEAYLGYHPLQHVVLAVGGYDGTRALDNDANRALHTARRLDLMAAYQDADWRLGTRYAYVSNWKTVRGGADTRARQVSVWASRRLAPAWTAFARYDRTVPDRLATPDRHDVYANLGVEWRPRKDLRIAWVGKRQTVVDDDRTLRRVDEFGIWTQFDF